MKTVVKFFSVLILIGLLLVGVLLLVVELNKPAILSKVENWYAENHGGELKINDFDFQVIRSFPDLTINIDQVRLRDSSFSGRNHRNLSAGTIAFSCATRKLFSKKLVFNRFEIKDVVVDILVDSVAESTTKKRSSSDKVDFDLENWFSKKGLNFNCRNAQIKIINRPKKKRYTGLVNEVSGKFKPKGATLNGNLHLDVDMEEMGLNVKKGTFFNTAHVQGDLNPKIDIRKKEFLAPAFPLKIDHQNFMVSTHFNLGSGNFFDFELVNEATDYQASKELISQDIQEKIEVYELTKPFYTKTRIQGKFKNGGSPLVTLDFNTKENQFIFNKTQNFDSLSLVGHLANRAIDQEVINSKNKKDFHIVFSKVDGSFEGVPFSLKDSYFQSTPSSKNLIQLDLAAAGNTEQLNQILKNDAFFFQAGDFDLKSYFRGNVKKPLDILTYATSEFQVNKTKVYYSKADFTVPVRKINFQTKNGNASLKFMRLAFPNNQYLDITGDLENYTSLLFDELKDPIKSTLKIKSQALDFEGLMATLNEVTTNKEVKKLAPKEQNLRAVFENIYLRFNPELNIKVNQFSYQNLIFKDFKTLLNYQDKNTLILSNSNFKFGDNTINLNGQVNLPDGNATQANLGIKADGTMADWNKLFDNKDFIIKSGNFNLTADYQGSLDAPKDLLTESKVGLVIKDAKIYHADQDLIIPIDSALIFLENRDASLTELSIPLYPNNHISITGKVNNFTSLLQPENGYEVSSNVKIYSRELSSKNFKRITEIFAGPKQETEPADPDGLHRAVATIYDKFHPSLEIQIDNFKSQDYLLNNLQSKIYYKNPTTLSIDNTGFDLDKGRLDLSAIFNFSEKEKIITNLSLSANGEARRFDKLFNNNTFFFKEGIFDFKLDFDGNLLDKKNILEHIDSRLLLEDSRVFYKDMNLTVPLDDVDLVLRNEDAIINSFVIPLTSGHRIEVMGKVESFNSLLLDSIPDEVVSDLNIYSKELDFSDLSRMFDVITEADSLSEKEVIVDAEKTNVFKLTVQGMYDKFRPTVNVVIDDFWYKTFNAKNIKTGLKFQDRNHLDLRKTEFELGEAHVLLDAELDLTELDRTGFNTDFTTDNLILEELIPAFDFFGLPSLKTAGDVSGNLSVASNLNGHIIDEKGKIDNTLKGTVAFDLEDLRLKNFDPILSTAGKILRDKRIKDIQFSPVIDTLTIDNGTIKLPELNITSTAFTIYMMGDFRYDNKSNLLISIPWSNLWFWDPKAMPKKLNYGESGKKFHIHALGNHENTMDYKFRFTGKKWYKTRGMLPLYRKEKRWQRQERRRYKRARRKVKRSGEKRLN